MKYILNPLCGLVKYQVFCLEAGFCVEISIKTVVKVRNMESVELHVLWQTQTCYKGHNHAVIGQH